jgi:thioesterase domain-containing protein/acyl carrier protein
LQIAPAREKKAEMPPDDLANELVRLLHEGTRGRVPLGALEPGVDLVADFGLDSIEALDVLLRVEERFRLALADEDLSREMFRTFGHFRSYVAGRLSAADEAVADTMPAAATAPAASSLPAEMKVLRAQGRQAPAFFVPGGTGGLTELVLYSQLVLAIDCDRPAYQFVARGLESDEPPHASVAEIADAWVTALAAVQPAGPVILIGGCIGGVVAFELAQRLSRAGREIALLLMLDTWSPAFTPATWLATGGLRAMAMRTSLLAYHKAKTQVRRALGEPEPDRDEVMLERVQRVGRLYQEAILRYRPAPYAGTITLIASDEAAAIDPALGWTGTAARLVKHRVPGSHDATMRENCADLAACVRACLGIGT